MWQKTRHWWSALRQRGSESTARVLRLRPRGEKGSARRVDFAELAPDSDTYLGQASYLQLGYFETLAGLIVLVPELHKKEALSRAAEAALLKHHRLIALIRSHDRNPLELMRPFREQLDAFRSATHGVTSEETMLSVYVSAGILDDFYLALASSYGALGREAAHILRADRDHQGVVDMISEAIAADSRRSDILSLWGRRMVGDTLLIARETLRRKKLDHSEEERVEPVFTELLAAHARRMKALGLDA